MGMQVALLGWLTQCMYVFEYNILTYSDIGCCCIGLWGLYFDSGGFPVTTVATNKHMPFGCLGASSLILVGVRCHLFTSLLGSGGNIVTLS